MFTIRLPKDLEARLTVLSEVTNRPKSFYVREALKRSLHDIEDAYMAERAYEAFIASGEAPIPLSDVEKKLALAD